MQRQIITPPRDLWRQFSVDWDIDWRGQEVGQTTGGVSKIVQNALPRWIGSPSLVLYHEMVGRWRAMRATAQGRVGVFRLPLVDTAVFSLNDVASGQQAIDNGLAFDNGKMFLGGKGWRYDPFVLMVDAAAAGADVIRVDAAAVGLAPRVGQIMSQNDYPFLVAWVSQVDDDIYDLGIQMPLRAAISTGARVKMQGEGLFEMVEAGGGNPSYGLNRVSRPQMQFREWLR